MSDDHLKYTMVMSGAKWYPPLPDVIGSGGEIRLRESTSNERTSFWLDVTQSLDVDSGITRLISIEITEDVTRQLAEQLDYAIYVHRHNQRQGEET